MEAQMKIKATRLCTHAGTKPISFWTIQAEYIKKTMFLGGIMLQNVKTAHTSVHTHAHTASESLRTK